MKMRKKKKQIKKIKKLILCLREYHAKDLHFATLILIVITGNRTSVDG